MENYHEITAQKNGEKFLIGCTEYMGKLLNFTIYFRLDNEWYEQIPPYSFDRSEIAEMLKEEIEEKKDAIGYASAAAEATTDFQSNQRL